MEIVKLSSIKKSFGNSVTETHAIRGIDLSIKKGSFTLVSGPSGCGKSTLLSILGLLTFPNVGEYVLNDCEIKFGESDDHAKLRSSMIGIVFQSFNLISELRVVDNIALPLRYTDPMVPNKVCKQRVTEIAKKFGLEGKLNSYPTELSGGQQQLVAIARAIIKKPKIILADEPTGNLDSDNAEIILDVLSDLLEFRPSLANFMQTLINFFLF